MNGQKAKYIRRKFRQEREEWFLNIVKKMKWYQAIKFIFSKNRSLVIEKIFVKVKEEDNGRKKG